MADDVINFKIFLGHGKNKGKTKIQKRNYHKNKKSFLEEIKSTFHSF